MQIRDQTAHSRQSEFDQHHPQKLPLSSKDLERVGEEIKFLIT